MASGVVIAVAGAGLLLVSPLFVLLMIAGLIYAAVAPGRIRPIELATVDAEVECLVGSEAVPLEAVIGISGEFATKGWDGFSVISAVSRDESSVPVVMLLGADEPLAQAVCATLGAILDCPAEYTCQPFAGIVFQQTCQILCTMDCECPAGLTCFEVADKSGAVWYQCG